MNLKKIHGKRGAYSSGKWFDIEDCSKKFNIKNGGGDCKEKCKACLRSQTKNFSSRKNGYYDIVIIGAGCIGSSIARELSKTSASVLLLEAADDVSQGATKGNSGIVHSGYDDKPGSVKSKFCWLGNQMFEQLDQELHFGFQKNGSLVIAKGLKEEKVLTELIKRGEENGVKNLQLIDWQKLKKKEPFIHPKATKALYSPDAGTLTPYEYTIALCENATDNGVELRTRREVIKVYQNVKNSDFRIVVKYYEPIINKNFLSIKLVLYHLFFQSVLFNSTNVFSMFGSICLFSFIFVQLFFYFFKRIVKKHTFIPSRGTVCSGNEEDEIIKTSYIVNAAGCSADKVARLLGDNFFKIKPRRGDYILFNKKEGQKVNHTIFPVPHPYFGKGVLVQNTLWGNLIIGPTSRDLIKFNTINKQWESNEQELSRTNVEILSELLFKGRKVIPDLNTKKIIHTFSGDRAKSTYNDWIIKNSPSTTKIIHVAGIDSPGIAASPAIALKVINLLTKAKAPILDLYASFNPNRAPIIVPKLTSLSGLKSLKIGLEEKCINPIQNVVCKCEMVMFNNLT